MDLKTWLENNKVFFEIGASLLFGVSALTVSLASYHVSKQQLVIAQIDQQPRFYLQNHYTKNPDESKYSGKVLEVFNSGAEISEFSSNIVVMAQVNYFDPYIDSFSIPVLGYYFESYYPQMPNGKLITYAGYKNNDNWFAFSRQVSAGIEKSGQKDFELFLEEYLKITYMNLSGERKSIYFCNGLKCEGKPVEDLFLVKSDPHTINIDSSEGAERLLNLAHEKEKI